MRLRQTATATKAGPAEGREGGRKEGRKAGERRREKASEERGSDIALPFQRQAVFYAARAITPSPLPFVRTRASEGGREKGRRDVRTYSLTDCCLRPATRTALREGDEREDTHEHEVSPRSSSLAAAAAAHVCGRTNERTNDRWNEEEQRHLDIVHALPAMNELKGRGQSVARARSLARPHRAACGLL